MKLKTVFVYGVPVLALFALGWIAGLTWHGRSPEITVTADPKYDCFDPPEGKPKDPKHPLYGYAALKKVKSSLGGFDHCDVTFEVKDRNALDYAGHPEVGLLAGDTLTLVDSSQNKFDYRIGGTQCFPPVTDVTIGHPMATHHAGTVVFYGDPKKHPECKYEINFIFSAIEAQVDPHISVGGRGKGGR